MKPDIHGVRTPWIRGFMAFKMVRGAPCVRLMVLAWPESGFGEGAARPAAVWLGGIALDQHERGIHVVPTKRLGARHWSRQWAGSARVPGVWPGRNRDTSPGSVTPIPLR